MNQSSGDDAALGDLARHLRDAQRPAQLVGGARADDHLPHRLQRRGRQVPGLAAGLHDRARRIALDVLDAAARDAEQADLVAVAEAVGQLGPARASPAASDRLAVAPDDDRHRHARIEPHHLLDVLEALDRLPVDADDHVAGLDAAASAALPGWTWPTSAGVKGWP